MSKPVIYPAILSKNFQDYEKKIQSSAKYFEGAQIDVMDGKFVKNKTYQNLAKLNRLNHKKLFIEIHLMVQDPFKHMLKWAKIADRYIIHIESTKDVKPLILLARGLEKGIGLAINPNTRISVLTPYIKDIDIVLIMTINPGWSGQKLIPRTLSKIKALHKKYPRLTIEVDGGINLETIKQVCQAGARLLVAGSAIWVSPDIEIAKKNLLKKCYAP